jgi:hypothetical protein
MYAVGTGAPEAEPENPNRSEAKRYWRLFGFFCHRCQLLSSEIDLFDERLAFSNA